MDTNDFLAHYGVLGMKWGKRKDRRKGVEVRKSTDRKEAEKALSRPIEQMTNKQLKTANTRLQLERSYQDLTRKPGFVDRVRKGNDNARVLLGVGGTVVAAAALYNNKDIRNIVKAGATLIGKWAKSPEARDAGYYTATKLQRAITR
jgi:hypothetical protein